MAYIPAAIALGRLAPVLGSNIVKQAAFGIGTAAAFALPGAFERRATAQEANASNLEQHLYVTRMLDQLRRQREGTSQLAGLAQAFQQQDYNPSDRFIGSENADLAIQAIVRRHQDRLAASSLRSQPSVAEMHMQRLLSRY